MTMGDGNGSGRFEIDPLDMGGWLRVHPHTADVPEDLPVYLSQTVAAWFRARPHFHLRLVVPITKQGQTWELHAWYDVHVLPASPLGPQPTREGER